VTPGIEELADKIAARGVKRIEGAVVGDDTAYLWEPFPDGWAIDDPLYEYGAPVSALTINDNSFRLEVRPGAAAGEAPEVYVFPDVGQVTVIPLVDTVAAGEKGRVRLERPAHTNELRVYGTIAAGAKPYSILLGVADPALYAAQALQDALARRGVLVREVARARHRTGLEEEGGDGSVVLAERQSPRLAELLRVVDKVSQNLHAELLLREVGRQGGTYGSSDKSVAALRVFLEGEAGVGKEDVNFTDGSGMSRLTLVTPEATTKLLLFMSGKVGWVEALPVGGVDGTLRRRFTGAGVREKVRAKTGSLSHVSALGGYLEHPRLGRLAFTVVLNNYNTPTSEARAGIDKLVTTLLE
jgi:D-alanyl-D-alanine carboxypeptidase/D-alanyl-D-alanine-endopeptidase (penicillin-binding protein 4)